ncbi:MAG: glycosyltransferase family 2 protein [Limisphaerales bacterium]
MDPALLTIAIPTRNRSEFLRESLFAFVDQILALDSREQSCVRLHVSDNTSTDSTPEVIRAAQSCLPGLSAHRHPENVGASRNVNSCVRAAATRHCWVVGDDEHICPGAVRHVLELLTRQEPPDLLVCFDSKYDPRLSRPQRFPSYRHYAEACAAANPHALIEHTLVSSNVFRTSLFDQAIAEATLATDYSHMYAVLSSLATQGGTVHVSEQPVITVRRNRAPAVDGVWPTNLEASWLEYLRWQRETFGVPTLIPEAALDQVRRQLVEKLTRHPLQYLRDNAKSLRDPKALVWFVKRLFFHSKRP